MSVTLTFEKLFIVKSFTPDGAFYEIKVDCLSSSPNHASTMTWCAEEFKIDKHNCIFGVSPSIIDGRRPSRFTIESSGNQLRIMDGHTDWSFNGLSIVLDGFISELRGLVKSS